MVGVVGSPDVSGVVEVLAPRNTAALETFMAGVNMSSMGAVVSSGFVAILILAAFAPLALAETSARTAPEAGTIGIWKSAVPPGRMHGEFASHDPIGLANGALIKADCSINWTDPDTRKLYCFSVPTSLAYFLYWPRANIARASRAWEGMPHPLTPLD